MLLTFNRLRAAIIDRRESLRALRIPTDRAPVRPKSAATLARWLWPLWLPIWWLRTELTHGIAQLVGVVDTFHPVRLDARHRSGVQDRPHLQL